MNKEYCEKVRVSAMAILDGEVPQLSRRKIDEHLKSCADCRRELEQQKEAIGLLDGRNRRFFAEDVCSGVAAAIEESRAKLKDEQGLIPFMVLGLILLVYKVIEVLPDFTPGLVIKLMPLVPIFVFFSLLKQNPLRINQDLKLKGDIR